MSFNKITIIGNLGRDPELRYTPQGIAVCTFTVATNDKRKNAAGEYTEVVTWFKVTAWRGMAENIAKYLVKGSGVYIEGRMRVDEWTDNENRARYTLDVQATECQFLNSGNRSDEDRPQQQQQQPPSQPQFSGPAQTNVSNAGDDDIPF